MCSFIMKKWNKFEKIKPIESDYPIVVVSKKESKNRTVYNIQVALEESLIHLSKKHNYVFTKWLKLPDYMD
jgi:hypothetical protein